MQQLLFQELEQKIEKIIEKYELIKKEKDEKENQISRKDKENFEARKQIETLLRERAVIKKRIDTIVEKLDSSGLL